jgi:hypothetical protein
LGRRASNRRSLAIAIATKILPLVHFRSLGCPEGNSGLSGQAVMKVAAPFQRVVAPSIGKWTN